MILVDEVIKEKLKMAGVATSRGAPFTLAADSVFEPPCSMKWMQVEFMLRLGAFSYAVSGHYFGAVIGRYTSIGENVSIGRGSHPVNWASTSPILYSRLEDVLDLSMTESQNYRASVPYIPPVQTYIGSDVYIGHGCFIMQGLKIGDGAIIGAHSVVTKDVPDYAVVAGAPAVIKKMRFPDRIIQRMVRVGWWQYAFWDLSDSNVSEPEIFLDHVERRIAAGIQAYSPKPVVLAELISGT